MNASFFCSISNFFSSAFFAILIRSLLYLWVYSLFTNSDSVISFTDSFPRNYFFIFFPFAHAFKWISNGWKKIWIKRITERWIFRNSLLQNVNITESLNKPSKQQIINYGSIKRVNSDNNNYNGCWMLRIIIFIIFEENPCMVRWQNDKKRFKTPFRKQVKHNNQAYLCKMSPVFRFIQHSPKAVHACTAIFPQHRIKVNEREFCLWVVNRDRIGEPSK